MRLAGLCSMKLAMPLLAALLFVPSPGAAQQRIPGPHPGATVVATATRDRAPELPTHHAAALRRATTGRLVLGGVIGAAVGVLACNLISEAIEEAEESSHCTTKGNLMFGIGGAAIGVLVAVLTD